MFFGGSLKSSGGSSMARAEPRSKRRRKFKRTPPWEISQIFASQRNSFISRDEAGWQLVGFPGAQVLFTEAEMQSKGAFTRGPVLGLQSQTAVRKG